MISADTARPWCGSQSHSKPPVRSAASGDKRGPGNTISVGWQAEVERLASKSNHAVISSLNSGGQVRLAVQRGLPTRSSTQSCFGPTACWLTRRFSLT